MKKILKNLFLILSIIFFSFFIVNCTKKEKLSKKEVIERFVENSKNLKSADMNSEITLKDESDKNSKLNLNFSTEASIIIEPFSMKINMTIPMQSQKVEMYIKNEYVYILNPMTNQWIKKAEKELNQYLKNSLASSNEIYDIIKNNVDKIDLQEKDKYYIMTIADATLLFEDAFKKQLLSLNLNNNDLLNSFPIENLFLTYTIDKKTYLPISSYSQFDIIIEGKRVNMSIDTKFYNIDKVKEIKLPEEAAKI